MSSRDTKEWPVRGIKIWKNFLITMFEDPVVFVIKEQRRDHKIIGESKNRLRSLLDFFKIYCTFEVYQN